VKEVILQKDLPFLELEIEVGTNFVNIRNTRPDEFTYNLGSWTKIGSKGAGFNFIHESVIDVAGYTGEEMTFFPLAGDVQRGATSLGLTTAFITEWIIASTVPITNSSFSVLSPFNVWNTLPGQFSQGDDTESGIDFDQIIFGQMNVFTKNSNLDQNWGVRIHTSSTGSGAATNGSKIYVYRIIRLDDASGPGGSYATIPSARLLLSGQLREEAEYAQIMRMRRSYELQQSYDED
jgi:hypothetical protein